MTTIRVAALAALFGALAIPASAAQPSDITLELVDQAGAGITGSRFFVGGVQVLQGGVIDLPAGAHTVTVFPGIREQITSRLFRDETVQLSGADETVQLTWDTAPLQVEVTDQTGNPIPNSRMFVYAGLDPSQGGSLGQLLPGEAVVLPITEFSSGPAAQGEASDGYGIQVLPGIGPLLGNGLARNELGVEHQAGGTLRSFVWNTAPLTAPVVDQAGSPISNSRVFLFAGTTSQPTTRFATLTHGDSITVPVTVDPGSSPIFGSAAGGYTAQVFPGIAGSLGNNLVRNEPAQPHGSAGTNLSLVWKTHPYTAAVVDQDAGAIPGSRVLVFASPSPVGSPVATLFTGDSVLLPVTEDPGAPAIFGDGSDGYSAQVLPGIAGLPGNDLASDEPATEHDLASTTRTFEWEVVSGNLQVVDANESPVATATVSQVPVLGTIPSGSPVSLPITDSALYSGLTGNYAAGYPDVFLQLAPGAPQAGPFTFEFLSGDVIGPAFVQIDGFSYGLRFQVAAIDTDHDQIPDLEDNCPLTPNPDQSDLDGDGVGDTCDLDDDNDGVPDAVDNCPTASNADQADADLDGLGDVCDGEFNTEPVLNQLDDLLSDLVAQLNQACPPGVNGMIRKLCGKGGVARRVEKAVHQFADGSLTAVQFTQKLGLGLKKLDAFDRRVAAKIQNGQLAEPHASAIVLLSDQTRALIESLIP